jgi:hypothetical protein
MGKHGIGTLVGAVALVALAAGSARADLTASYDGSLNGPRGAISLAGVLNQASAAVSGTLAVDAANPAAAGLYWVNGTVRGKSLALSGTNANGTRFKWRVVVKNENVLRGPAKLKGAGVKMNGSLVMTRRTVEPPTSATCESAFFTGQVMGRVLQPICANCHSAGGAAATANFRVTAGDALATQASVDSHIDKANLADSRILRKPLNLMPHAGGAQLAAGSEEYGILEQWVNLVATDQQCSELPTAPMVPLAPAALLMRASMDSRGQRPSVAELDQMEADPNSYTSFVDQYLHSAEFLLRVKDAYDDALLVRREDFSDEARDKTDAIYGEALELIAYIVANDRPFTEIGTADYTVANQLFQSDPGRMPYPMEPVTGAAWQPTHYTDGRPHAGVLSTSAFYQVWDTNNTNKNRRRANRASILFHCYNFLDTPVDVTRNVDNNDPNAVLNAVTTRPDCKACHDRLDPLASFLFPLDNAQALEGNGGATDFFRGNPERWRTANRRPPAVYGVGGTDIRDMGRLLTAHPKFAECQTKRAFKMLFLRDPKSNAELAAASDITTRWRTEDGYNFRALVRRWMLSDVYKNHPETNDAEWVRRVNPERLELALEDMTGFVWTRDADNDQDDNNPESDPPRVEPVSLLTNEEDGFKIILGGINGVSVSGRSYGLNASVALVQRKLAALAAASVVTNDLALPDGSRKVLNGVTGAENPATDEAALRAAIARLIRRFYGDNVAPTSPQVDNWLSLYQSLYADRSQATQVMGTAGQRAWRGMLAGMLRSPRIILY